MLRNERVLKLLGILVKMTSSAPLLGFRGVEMKPDWKFFALPQPGRQKYVASCFKRLKYNHKNSISKFFADPGNESISAKPKYLEP